MICTGLFSPTQTLFHIGADLQYCIGIFLLKIYVTVVKTVVRKLVIIKQYVIRFHLRDTLLKIQQVKNRNKQLIWLHQPLLYY